MKLILVILSLVYINSIKINIDNKYKKASNDTVTNNPVTNATDDNTVQADAVDRLNVTDSKIMKMNSTSQDAMINPKIEIIPKLDPMSKFHPVKYVKEISAAGKVALELTNSGEYMFII